MSCTRHIATFLILLLSLSANADNALDTLADAFSFQDQNRADEILDPELAFKVNLEQYSANQLSLQWQVEKNYYLYKDKFSIRALAPSVTLSTQAFPSGTVKQDPEFGQVEAYYGNDQAFIQFQVSDTTLKEIAFEVAYQGCKENVVCYPPIKKIIPVAINLDHDTNASSNQSSLPSITLSEQDLITQKLKDKSLLLNILSFFGFGLLLSLTPCVFPMIPILSGIIIGAGRITRKRAFALSASYVIAMAFSYAILGVIASLFDFNLQAAAQNSIVLILFSGIFIVLALSMFGFYELQLPASLQSKLSARQNQAKSGRLAGAGMMGILSAIIVGPCVAPPLAGALLYISQTGDALLGGLALFALGVGLGVPLLVIGAGSGALLPRVGAWMVQIKQLFGVIMLGVAIWLLERILPPAVTLILWATLLITTAIFIGAFDRTDGNSTPWQRLFKGLGLVLFVYGSVLIVAAANGHGTVLKPFSQSTLVKQTTQTALSFQPVTNLEQFQQQLQQANKPILLYFYADWCIACKELEAYTYSEQSVQRAFNQFVLLKADVTEYNEMDQAFLNHFNLSGPPAILFFKQQHEIPSKRLIGFIKAAPFTRHLKQILSPAT